ncbi:MAG: YbhB/YbcL family Raf kinase inhibitor-like protein [Deltaproteobacteria bacterium]|nr:YbhB/YbcL family Raf kinase inhibitor-like protein [Deltaproteobacteria bacterium]
MWFVLVMACGESGASADASSVDAAGLPDAGPDATADAGFLEDAASPDANAPDADLPDAAAVPFVVTSTAFAEGGTVPLRYECGPPLQGPGDNISPNLTWTNGPAGTQSYAVVVRDTDARVPQFPEGIIHWVIYNIPATVHTLPEGIPGAFTVAAPAGARQANIQGSGFFGYFGPCSPTRVNTYVWTVHAMPTVTVPNVSRASSESTIAAEIEATSIAQATLSGES